MSVQADPSGPSNLLELPCTWLAHLVQHLASGTGGLANAAALSQTYKYFHALSDSSAVTYRNLHLDKPLQSLGHPFFGWLAKRQARVAGLTAELWLLTVDGLEPEPEQLQLMFSIPGLHLTVRCDAELSTLDDPFMTNVLRPHGPLIDHLISRVCINGDGLQDFCEAAAVCRRLDRTVKGSADELLDMVALNPAAGSLIRLNLDHFLPFGRRELGRVSSLSLLSQLTSLSLDTFHFRAEEPWTHLVGLTNLKQLTLRVAASGDPSPLSALSGLSSLKLQSSPEAVQGGLFIPCTFSSLQPLSTLQQLKGLVLHGEACSATSLHGLAELNSLETLELTAPVLRSLGGISTGLTSLTIDNAPHLDSLAGIEHLQGLQELSVCSPGVTSLHPLAALGSLGSLCISGTFTSLAGLEGNLCTCLHNLRLDSCSELRQLSGIEGLTALQRLIISVCGLTSLQPIGQLVGGLRELYVWRCYEVQEQLLDLPHVQPTAQIGIIDSNVKVVVLAGGVRRVLACWRGHD